MVGIALSFLFPSGALRRLLVAYKCTFPKSIIIQVPKMFINQSAFNMQVKLIFSLFSKNKAIN